DPRQSLLAVLEDQFIERRCEALELKVVRFTRIENLEAWINAGRDRVLAQQPGAKAVDGRNPGRFQFAQPEFVAVELLGELRVYGAGGILGEVKRQFFTRSPPSSPNNQIEHPNKRGGLPGSSPPRPGGIAVPVWGGVCLFCGKPRPPPRPRSLQDSASPH